MLVKYVDMGAGLILSAVRECDLLENLSEIVPPGSFSFAVNAEKLIRLEHDELLHESMCASQFRYIDGVAAKWCIPRNTVPKILLEKIDLPMTVVERCLRSRLPLSVVGASQSELADACDALCRMGVELDSHLHGYHSDEQIIDFLTKSKAEFTLLGVGSPRQERLAYLACRRGVTTRVIPCGGAIRLLGGVVSRAPKWMQQGGLETLYRLFLEPSRLKRYSSLAKVIPIIQWRRTITSGVES